MNVITQEAGEAPLYDRLVRDNTIVVRVGDEYVFYLSDYDHPDGQWTVEALAEPVCEIVATWQKGYPEYPGSGLKRFWRLRALRVGESRLRATLGSVNPSQFVEVKVVVRRETIGETVRRWIGHAKGG